MHMSKILVNLKKEKSKICESMQMDIIVQMNSPNARNRVWMASKATSGHWALLLFVCIRVSLYFSGKHIA